MAVLVGVGGGFVDGDGAVEHDRRRVSPFVVQHLSCSDRGLDLQHDEVLEASISVLEKVTSTTPMVQKNRSLTVFFANLFHSSRESVFASEKVACGCESEELQADREDAGERRDGEVAGNRLRTMEVAAAPSDKLGFLGQTKISPPRLLLRSLGDEAVTASGLCSRRRRSYTITASGLRSRRRRSSTSVLRPPSSQSRQNFTNGPNLQIPFTLSPHESRYFENSYIPENTRTPKPLTFSKNRLRGAKNRSNISPVAKKFSRKNDFFFPKTLHMCKKKKNCICAQSLYSTYLKGLVKKNLKENAKKKSCIYAQK
ncbi:hypothetical protein LXL04_010448 [Taraxacum kok-saghyz]